MELDKSENAGLRVARVFGNIEQSILANRRILFLKAVKSPQGFKNGVLESIGEFRNSNINAVRENLDTIKSLVAEEIGASVDAGVTAVKKTVSKYEEQGKEFKQLNEGFENSLKERRTGISLGVILGVFSTMLVQSENQVKQITSLVNVGASDLLGEIDRVQNSFLSKGIVGKVLANGTEKEAYAEVEFLMRDLSHKSLLEAQGETGKQVGLNPLVIVSAHPSSCKLCQPWQGQVLIDDVYQGGIADGKYQLLSTAINSGLGHYNCRHNWVNYVEGLDRPDIFENEKASKEKTAQNYAMEQRQREVERNIREYKRRESASLTEQARLSSSQKVAEWQAVQRALIENAKKNNLSVYRQYSREQIGGKTLPTKRV